MYGNVYGKRAGQVTITASNADWSVIGTYVITVNQPVTSIEFNDTMILKNLSSEPSSLPVTILPLDATNPAINWASSNPEIAYVNQEGLLVVVSKGTSVIRATAVDGGQYDDIIVSVSEEALEQVSIKKVSQFRSNDSNTYTLALMTDGTLWVWGVNILVPTKTKFTGIKDIPVFVNLDNGAVLVLLNDDSLHLVNAYTLISTTNNNAQLFTNNNKITGITNIAAVNQNHYNTYYVIRNNGDVWGWGYNNSYGLGDGTNIYRNFPQKISIVANVTKISTSYGWESSLFLTNNGDLYIVGGNGADYSRATLLDSNVIDIPDAFHENRYQKTDGIYFKSVSSSNGSLQVTAKATDKIIYQRANGHYHSLSDEGKVTINNNSFDTNIVFSKIGILFYTSIYLISSDGNLYIFGANAAGQLANFNNSASQIPTKINFGIVVNEGGLLLDSQNVTNNATGVSVTTEFVFDFNTAIKGGNNLPAITLKDSNDNFVSVTASIKLDKLFIKVDELLIYGESYTLTLPEHLVVDYFNNVYNGQTLQFTIEEAPASVAGFEANGRFYWNTADLIEAIADYSSEGGMLGSSSSFGLNAILNNIQDPRSENWMRIVGTPTEQLMTFSMNYNYWGTESQNLINAQILDFDDFQTLLNIDASQIIKDDQLGVLETIYPFVLDFYFTNINDERTDNIDLSGGTMHIIFSQDMDTTILPNVYFGPDIPYTDYKIEGEWLTSRHWTGSVRVTLLTGDGYQYMRIRDAVSAHNAWLVAGDDEKRLQFEIITTGTESMTLQATSAEGRVILDWMQDEFTPELMAGYNVYRADSVDGSYTRINNSVISDTTYEDFTAAPGIVYYYKFTVVQTDFSESDFSNIAAANAFDNILPVLTHNVISTIRTGQDNTIVAYASDNIAVQNVTFSYRLKDQTTFTSFDMIRDGNTTKYTYLLKSSSITTSTFEYFITAYDGLSTVSSGTSNSPHQVTVLDVPTITNISPASGSSLGGTTVTITGANFKQGVKVYFAELEGLSVTLIDANRLTVVTPRYYASQVNVKVVNPFGGETIRTNGFTYESTEATVSIPTVKANINSEILVPIRVTNVTGLLALDMKVTYNKDVLTYVEFVKGTMGTRFTTFVNKNTLGELRISMAVDLSVTGSGDILYLKFKVVNAAFEDSAINIDTVELNGGNIPAIKTNGLVTYEPVLTVGTTVYYFGNNRAVENVTILLSNEEVEHLGVTNANGVFTFTSVSKGDYDLTFTKQGDTDAISALDAALVLQQAVGLISLSSNQQIVADVNNDTKINSLDASYILQYVAGFTVLPFAGRDSSWLFISNTTSFTDLAANANVSVTAYLIGDVSGNYGSTGTTVTSLDGAYRVGPIQTSQGLLYVPVDIILNADNVFALSFRLTFDASLRVKEVRYHQSLENAFKVANTNVAGQITVAIAGVDALTTMLGLIEVVLEPTQAKDTYAFSIVSSMINESRNLVNIMNNYTTITSTDFNGDNVVNQEDLITLVDVLNKSYQDTDISPFDFNSDGIIDLYDIIAMIQSQRIPA
jgi:alpha-tubulin suppressor-like RCC1 family protein